MSNPGQTEMKTPCSTYKRSVAATSKFVLRYSRGPKTSWNFQEQNEKLIKVPKIFKNDTTWWLNPSVPRIAIVHMMSWTQKPHLHEQGKGSTDRWAQFQAVYFWEVSWQGHTNTEKKKKVLTLFPHTHRTLHNIPNIHQIVQQTVINNAPDISHQTRLCTHTGQGHLVFKAMTWVKRES